MQHPMYLILICRKYVAHLSKIERCYDPTRLQVLEEQRVQLHNQVMDALDRVGIPYQDRWEVTELAHQIAQEGEI